MNPEMPTTWFDTYFQNLSSTRIPLEYEQILKEGERFWDDVNGGYLLEDLLLAARREEIEWVHSEGVYDMVPMQECIDSGQK